MAIGSTGVFLVQVAVLAIVTFCFLVKPKGVSNPFFGEVLRAV